MIILKPKHKKIGIYITKKRKIIYDGYFTLIKSYKMLIDDIQLQKHYKKVNINEKDLIKILQTNKIVLTNENNNLKIFLEEENILYNILHVCDNCLQQHKLTILSKKEDYSLGEKHYCKKCATSHLKQVIKSHNYYDYTESRLNIILNNTHDLMNVLYMIEKKYEPLKKPEQSLYDILPATEEKYEKIHINNLNIPSKFKEILNKKIDYLFPVQVKSIQKGLLEGNNLLIVSATASGKTLIGELAGITKTFENKKMIYLSPLVALANQKYQNFKRDYEKLGLKTVIKIGKNRVNTNEELHITEESVKDADIIVATYEGLDYILRSGNYKDLNELGVVVIDEIHMLNDEERGHRLNGLIHRLLTLFNDAQLIALSATIKNAKEISKKFNMDLIKYDKRPVKIERHIVPLNQNEKMKFIKDLCVKEFNTISSKKYRGQSIIFTDSRRNTQNISHYLEKNGVSCAYYHSGLTYNRKIEIEETFMNQELSAIVTTSALSNGIDFPASQVIFDSLRMGMDYLSPNDFHQMLGRAGRPSYHDLGKVYLLPIVNKYSENEYDIAYDLISSDVQNINVLFDVDDVYEQVLADICSIGYSDLESLSRNYDNLVLPITFKEAIKELYNHKMIKLSSDNKIAEPTSYGIAVSKSFISVNTAEYIRNNLYSDIIDICLNIKTINNVYLSYKLLNSFEKEGHIISSRLFSEKNRYMFYEGLFLGILGKKNENHIINFVNDFFICDCYNSPMCDCLEKNISEHIINRRLQGWSPSEISKEFKRQYELDVYPGDVYSYLDQIIRVLDAIKRISLIYNIQNTYDDCLRTIKKLEG